MTQRDPINTPPRPASPYASLIGNEAPAPACNRSGTARVSRGVDLAEESRRLGTLRTALWDCFEADPVTVPAALVDVIMAYTQALRLHLTLGQQMAMAQRMDHRPRQTSPQGTL